MSVCVYVTGTDGTCFEIPLWINGGSQRPDHTVVISILEGSGQTSGAQLDGRPCPRAAGFLMCEDAVVALRRRRRSVRSLDLLNENKQRRGLITHWRPSSVTTALHCTALHCTAMHCPATQLLEMNASFGTERVITWLLPHGRQATQNHLRW